MWENSLVVFHSDNGGEIIFKGICGGNNWPLRGGKFSNFEGGIRVNAFVSGGWVPTARGLASNSAKPKSGGGALRPLLMPVL